MPATAFAEAVMLARNNGLPAGKACEQRYEPDTDETLTLVIRTHTELASPAFEDVVKRAYLRAASMPDVAFVQIIFPKGDVIRPERRMNALLDTILGSGPDKPDWYVHLTFAKDTGRLELGLC